MPWMDKTSGTGVTCGRFCRGRRGLAELSLTEQNFRGVAAGQAAPGKLLVGIRHEVSRPAADVQTAMPGCLRSFRDRDELIENAIGNAWIAYCQTGKRPRFKLCCFRAMTDGSESQCCAGVQTGQQGAVQRAQATVWRRPGPTSPSPGAGAFAAGVAAFAGPGSPPPQAVPRKLLPNQCLVARVGMIAAEF